MSEHERSEAEYAMFMVLVAEGRECDHPEAFRHPLDRGPTLDGWRCGVCEDEFVKRDEAAR